MGTCEWGNCDKGGDYEIMTHDDTFEMLCYDHAVENGMTPRAVPLEPTTPADEAKIEAGKSGQERGSEANPDVLPEDSRGKPLDRGHAASGMPVEGSALADEIEHAWAEHTYDHTIYTSNERIAFESGYRAARVEVGPSPEQDRRRNANARYSSE